MSKQIILYSFRWNATHCISTIAIVVCVCVCVCVSVVTRWTVDQEVVGSNPTHGGNLISVVRSLSGFTQPIR